MAPMAPMSNMPSLIAQASPPTMIVPVRPGSVRSRSGGAAVAPPVDVGASVPARGVPSAGIAEVELLHAVDAALKHGVRAAALRVRVGAVHDRAARRVDAERGAQDSPKLCQLPLPSPRGMSPSRSGARRCAEALPSSAQPSRRASVDAEGPRAARVLGPSASNVSQLASGEGQGRVKTTRADDESAACVMAS